MGTSWHDASVPGSTHDEDPLRAAMERVRGNAQPKKSAPSPSPDVSKVVPLRPRRRGRLDVRGRMSDVLARVDEPAAVIWPAPIAGAVSGVWAAAMSLFSVALLIIVGWVFAPLGSGQFGDVLRVSGAAWLLADGGAFHWQGAMLSLPPLVLTLALLLFQRRAGRWLARATAVESASDAVAPVLSAILTSIVMHVLLATAIASASLSIAYGRSAAGAALVALLGFTWGMQSEVQSAIPAWASSAVAFARAYVGGLCALGAGVLVALVIVQRQSFMDVLHAVAGDTTSTLQVLVFCIAYLPTLLFWIVAVLVGTSVTIGVGTAVSLHVLTFGALPPIPLLALLPNTLPEWAGWFLAFAPAVAGTLIYLRRPDRSLRMRGCTVGLVAVFVLVLASFTAGGIGPGRLINVGVSPIRVALFASAWLALMFLLDEVLHRVRRNGVPARGPVPDESSSGT